MTREYFENNNNNNEMDNNEMDNNEMDNSEEYAPDIAPGPTEEGFCNMTFNKDLALKSIFWGALFYLLSLPELHKVTKGLVGKAVDTNLVHAIVYAVLYLVLVQFIRE